MVGFFSVALFAQTEGLNPTWDWQYAKLALGGKVTYGENYYGAKVSNDFGIGPAVALDLFSPHLQIFGNSLMFQHRISPLIRYRFSGRIRSTDNPLLSLARNQSELVDHTSSRDVVNFIEIGQSETFGELRLGYIQEVGHHFGSALHVQARYAPIRFQVGALPVQISAFGSFGLAEEKYKRFSYGTGVKDNFSMTQLEYGLQLTAVPVIDHYFPFFVIKRYHVLGSANQNASLVKAEDAGFEVQALFAINVLEHSRKKGWKTALSKK